MADHKNEFDQPTLPPPSGLDATPAGEWPTMARAEGDSPHGPPGAIPGYEIECELGRGGMGVVYKARQKGLNRPVALKMVLAASHVGRDALERFRAEAEAVAALQHPNIVQVFEVGEHQGQPFFSLELCALGSLDRKLNGTPLPVREAAALVRVLARAMQAAHDAGVVHRDLKPANVLLATGESIPSGSSGINGALTQALGAVPKITDFGLAKRLGTDSGQTRTGTILGTPSYMAPEQAEGKKDVGPAADTYALGAIFYECLTGRPPFKAATPLDTVLQVVSDEPAPPRQLNHLVPRDLETICLKCLQKEPAKRYASAGELGDDLGRFLADEPIRARPVTVLERAIKWARRRPAVAGLLALVVALTTLGVGLIFVEYRRAERALSREKLAHEWADARAVAAEAARADADAARELARQRQQRAEQLSELAGQRLDQLREAQRLARLTRYSTNLDRAQDELRARHPLRAAEWLNDCPLDGRGWEWAYHKRQASPEVVRCAGHWGAVWSVAWSPDGQVLATGSVDRTLRLWDARTGRQLRELRDHDGHIAGLAFSPDGKWFASATATESYGPFRSTWESAVSGDIKVWDTRSWRVVHTLPGIHSVAFSPDSKRLAAPTRNRGVIVYEVETGKVIHKLTGHGVATGPLAFSPDGTRLVTGAADRNAIKAEQWRSTAPIRVRGELKLWDLTTGKDITPAWPAPTSGVRRVAFLPGGTRVASLALDGALEIWDIKQGKRRHLLQGHDMRTEGLALLPDGRVLTTGLDARAILWDVASGKKLQTIDGPDFICEVSPNAGRLACASLTSGLVRIFDLQRAGAMELPLAEKARISGVQFSPDGKRIYALSAPPATRWYLHAFDAATGKEIYKRAAGGGQLVVTPDGKQLIVGGTRGLFGGADIILREAASGKELRTLKGHTEEVASLALSTDGRWLASTAFSPTTIHARPGELCIWDLHARGTRPVHRLTRPGGRPLLGVAISDDGKLVAGAGADSIVHLFDRATGKPVGTLTGSLRGLKTVAFRPGGAQLAAGTVHGQILVWDVSRRTLVRSMPRQNLDSGIGPIGTASVGALFYSRDGRRLISATGPDRDDGEIKLWDADTGSELLTLPGRLSAAFSPDGRRLAAGAGGANRPAVVRVWSEPAATELRVIRQHAGSVRGMAASRDGKRFASAADDGTVLIWDSQTGEMAQLLRGHEGRVWKASFSPAGRHLVSAGVDGARIWDLETGKALRHLKGHKGDVFAATFLGNDRVVTGGVDGRACLWQVEDGKLLRAVQHPANINSIAASPDGKRIATGAEQLRVWNVETGELVLSIDDVAAAITVAWSPDGKLLAVAENDQALRVWDATTGALVRDLGRAAGLVWALAWGRDSRLLASVGLNRVVTVFDTYTGKEAATFSGARYWGAGVACLAGGLLASSDAEGNIRFYRLPEPPAVPPAPRPDYPANPTYLARVTRAHRDAGRPAEALAHARQWRAAAEASGGAPAPEAMAIEALALHALKRDKEAVVVLARLRELMRNDWCAKDPIASRLYREALGKVSLPALPAVEEALRKTVLEVEFAAWDKADPEPLLALWSPEARSIGGRGPQPGPYDVTRDREALRFYVKSWRWGPRNPVLRGTVEIDQVQLEGASAEVRFHNTTTWPGGFHTTTVSLRLKKGPAGWKVAGQRAWAAARRQGQTRIVYDEAAFRAFDARVEAARTNNDLPALRQALMDALRHGEAHAVAKKITDAGQPRAEDWVARGEAALAAGDGADAIASARKARVAKAELPYQLEGALRQAK